MYGVSRPLTVCRKATTTTVTTIKYHKYTEFTCIFKIHNGRIFISNQTFGSIDDDDVDGFISFLTRNTTSHSDGWAD